MNELDNACHDLQDALHSMESAIELLRGLHRDNPSGKQPLTVSIKTLSELLTRIEGEINKISGQ